MKTVSFLPLLAASVAFVSAADVNVVATPDATLMPSIMTAPGNQINVVGAPMATYAPLNRIDVGTKSLLRRPTALINKNTAMTDNNVFVSKSNVMIDQNDQLALARKMEDYVMDHKQEDAAVLTRDIMRAVSTPDTDAAVMDKGAATINKMEQDLSKQAMLGRDTNPGLMNKASAIVTAAKADDKMAMRLNIADLIKTYMQEQAIQAQNPQLVNFVGGRDILRQPSAVINKNRVISDNQLTIARSQFAPKSNDQVVMTDGAKVANAIGSGSSIFVAPKQEQADAKVPTDPTKAANGKLEQWGGGWYGRPWGWGGGWYGRPWGWGHHRRHHWYGRPWGWGGGWYGHPWGWGHHRRHHWYGRPWGWGW